MEERFRSELLENLGMLDKSAVEQVDRVLTGLFSRYTVGTKSNEVIVYDGNNNKILGRYLASMRLEGKSEQTMEQYKRAIQKMLDNIGKPLKDITTNDIRYHLSMYQSVRKVSKATLDNERRYLSAFFAWVTAEEYVVKNPMLRIKKVKEDKKIKKAFSDYEIEKLRENCKNKKEKAIIEFFLSTGCRVSEVVGLDIKDVDFDKGECTVFGKGSKERTVYLTEKSIYYLKEYLGSRKKESQVLFANKSGKRWSKQSIEKCLKNLGKRAVVDNVHPHRFRRTFATNALNKGMPIQYVQKILGHKSMDTTLIYCVLDMESIKLEHKKVA